ncbi:ABC transporter ATP-binding protein [Bombilactobacillus thymidiniphilus]|uniref:ABC transporter ATP-binding protein n=1 Tax=Bombilactobacillus thymidiniphilus TaxID=2923363 RepID=A0ABY4PC66_9LACO|nr:ABC transporter ATP-binding protein [Bombilactobacillus thymidiniphilus]UQS83358.1 ABC transporter ATP-binding protein [Bombilactobacillus thymidiniphilus]
MAKRIVQLQHVHKKFGTHTVLEDVSFNLDQGEIVGLIGPSGAGKSTIIKVTLGMEKADGGQITVFGEQMPQRQLLKKIGYMAQNDALYDSLTAYENLEFFAQMKGVSAKEIPAQIDHAAKIVDLKNQIKQRVGSYSGGMRRRLSLAIALLGNPPLIVLDEPTVGIDPALRRQIWHELSRLRDDGHAILVTTHVMDEAELTDRVALLLDGKLIANDKPKILEKQYQVANIEEVFLKAEGDLA